MSFERRKVRVGRVVSDKMDKTVIVDVEWRRPHPLYRKSVRRKSRFLAHDAESQCQIGDQVRIVETRPLSKTKRWRVAEILAREEIAEIQPDEIAVDESALRAIAEEPRPPVRRAREPHQEEAIAQAGATAEETDQIGLVEEISTEEPAAVVEAEESEKEPEAARGEAENEPVAEDELAAAAEPEGLKEEPEPMDEETPPEAAEEEPKEGQGGERLTPEPNQQEEGEENNDR